MSRDKFYYRQYRLQKLAGRKKLSAQAIYDAAQIQRLADDFQTTYGYRPKIRLKEKTMDEIGHLLKHEGDIKDLQHSQADHASNPNAHGHADRLQALENKLARIPDELLDVLASLPDDTLSDLVAFLEDFADGKYTDDGNTAKGRQGSAAR